MLASPPPIPATGLTREGRAALRLQRELWRVLSRSVKHSVPLNAVNATICAAILAIHEPVGPAIAWAAAHWLIAGLRLSQFSHRRNRIASQQSARLAFFGLTFLQGALWGAAPICLAPTGDPMSIAIITFMIAGMTSGALLTLMPQSAAVALFVTPSIGGLFLHYVLQPGLATKGVALVLLFYLASTLTVSSKIRGYLIEAIRKKWALGEKNAEIERKNGELFQLAHYDALTGAANRKFLESNGQRLLDDALAQRSCCAFFHIDLDHFKHINDSLGHAAGDALLRETADRIRRAVRKRDVVFRLGGDEFGLMAFDLDSIDDAREIAAKVLDALEKPVEHGRDVITCRASIGVAVAPDHGEDIHELMTNADIALQNAKESGRATFAICDEHSQRRAMRRAEIGDRLRNILREEDFDYAYQPIFDIRTGRLHAAEILLRFKSLPGQDHSTEEFIKIAEHGGLIGDLAGALLTRGLSRSEQFLDAFPSMQKISINLSPTELRSQKIMRALLKTLEEGPLPAACVQIEMLENAILDRGSDYVLENLRLIVATGATVVLDDFGTGYSSLSHLRSLPVAGVKIDKSFIRTICTDKQDAAIVRSTIALAHSLDMTVTIEGVETEEQYRLIRKFGADFAQGYLMSKPVSSEAFIRIGSNDGTGCPVRPRLLAAACDDCHLDCDTLTPRQAAHMRGDGI